MVKKVWIAVFIVVNVNFLSSFNLVAQTLSGKVVNVIDGNTFEIDTKERGLMVVKLWGSDSPVLEQQYGKEAQDFLADKIHKKKLEVEIKGRDRKGTKLVVVPVKKGGTVNELMITEGFAWAERMYAKSEYQDFEKNARSNQLGLWQFDQPVEPEIFRRRQSMQVAKTR